MQAMAMDVGLQSVNTSPKDMAREDSATIPKMSLASLLVFCSTGFMGAPSSKGHATDLAF